MKRRTDKKDLMTTFAALAACAVMGAAVGKIMAKQPLRYQQPPMESLSTPSHEEPAKTSPSSPRPSRIASGGITA